MGGGSTGQFNLKLISTFWVKMTSDQSVPFFPEKVLLYQPPNRKNIFVHIDNYTVLSETL